jgi:hypothetical protein
VGEPGGGEGVEQGVAARVDVEVAERQQIVPPVVLLACPVGQPPRDGGQLQDPVGRPLSPLHVQGDRDERLAAGLKAHRVRRARELLHGRGRPTIGLGQHQLAARPEG